MHLQRNFVWTLDLSDRELKVILKSLQNEEDLTEKEQSLAENLAEKLPSMIKRLERVSTGKRRNHTRQ